MKRYLVLLAAAAVSMTLAACGHSVHTSSTAKAQEQALATNFDSAMKRCLPSKDGAPDVLVLRSKAGRHRFEGCAVPSSKRAAFNRCVTQVVLGGLPTKNRLKTGGAACLAKVER